VLLLLLILIGNMWAKRTK